MDEIRRRQIKLGIKLIAMFVGFVFLSVAVCTNWFQFEEKVEEIDEDIDPIISIDEIDDYIKMELENNPDADVDKIREELMSFYEKEQVEEDTDVTSQYDVNKIQEYLKSITGNNEDSTIDEETIEKPEEAQEQGQEEIVEAEKTEETNNSGYNPDKIKEFLEKQNEDQNVEEQIEVEDKITE